MASIMISVKDNDLLIPVLGSFSHDDLSFMVKPGNLTFFALFLWNKHSTFFTDSVYCNIYVQI